MSESVEVFEVHAEPETVAAIIKLIVDHYPLFIHRTKELYPRYILIDHERLRRPEE